MLLQRKRSLIKPKGILFMNKLGRICPFGVVELIVVETLGKRKERKRKTTYFHPRNCHRHIGIKRPITRIAFDSRFYSAFSSS
jgi:hypothetical protein